MTAVRSTAFHTQYKIDALYPKSRWRNFEDVSRSCVETRGWVHIPGVLKSLVFGRRPVAVPTAPPLQIRWESAEVFVTHLGYQRGATEHELSVHGCYPAAMP